MIQNRDPKTKDPKPKTRPLCVIKVGLVIVREFHAADRVRAAALPTMSAVPQYLLRACRGLHALYVRRQSGDRSRHWMRHAFVRLPPLPHLLRLQPAWR